MSADLVLQSEDGVLTVRGRSTSGHAYALEIADPVRAPKWAWILRRDKYRRYCFAYRKDPTRRKAVPET